ncbi:MAG: peptidyl-prolyl cis-trans isomerase [Lachnospiraceae bacterium]|nr:peptidyl-prolyl cis-trans isomerase [Lachnospiraceae bacterium]
MKGKKIIPLLLAAVMGISVLTGCGGIDGKKTGATLDGEEISLGFMNFMARYQQAIYDGQFSGMFGTGFWSQDLFGEGTDAETSVKKTVAENIETLYLLEDHMEDYKVEVTEDEQAKIDEAAKKFMESNSEAAIQQMGATEEYVGQMLRLNTIQRKMRKAMDAEVDTKVSDEEAAQKTISYVKVDNKSTTDEEGNSKDYTEEEKENLKKEVETFAASAAEDFKAAAENAGYTVSEASYGAEEETLDKALTEAADQLKEGELTGVITGEDAFYVARMDSTFDKEETEKRKDEIVTERKNDHYKEMCDKYKEGVKFELNEKEWAKVKFDDLFTIKQAEAAEDEGDVTGDNAEKEE